MKSILVVIIILGIYFMVIREEVPEYDQTNEVATMEEPQQEFDTLSNTYEKRVEAQNIANTINPSSSYLGSRLDARTGASNAVKVGNDRMEAQEKALDALMKP